MDTQLNLFPDDDILRAARPRLVGFSGRAGSGKSLCADYLVRQGWARVKFADPLKNMLRAFYATLGLSEYEIEARMEGVLKETADDFLNGKSPRYAMQTLGQEWGRELISPTLWVSAWSEAVALAWSKGLNVVVDDCRYPNEAAAINQLGGRVFMIVRGDAELVDTEHESERFEFTPDGVILNEGSIHDLRDKVGRSIE